VTRLPHLDPVTAAQGPILPEDTSLLLAGGAYAIGYLLTSVVLGPGHLTVHEVWRRRGGVLVALVYILIWATLAGFGATDVNVLPRVHTLFEVCNVFGIGPLAASVTAFVLRVVTHRDATFEDGIARRSELWYGLGFACVYFGHWLTG
jgi:hypothetical protein